jgi:Ca2+-binding EF-hand superfamily protein
MTRLIREKLRDYSKSSTDEYVLRGIFKEFDHNKSGNLTIDELTMMLAKLQISCDRKYITALFKKFDTNGNGVIEFEEFCDYIIRNPYK